MDPNENHRAPYVALTKGECSIVRAASEVASGRWEDWTGVAGEYGTPFDAYAEAARLGYMPGSWNDPMSPRPLDRAIPLYRSVSITELGDFLEIGAIQGRGNRFNDWDRRRFVFFGPEITERLIGQGEEIERQTIPIVLSRPEFAEDYAEIERRTRRLRSLRERGDPTTAPDERDLWVAIDELSRAFTPRYRPALLAAIRERKAEAEVASFTSAVLRFEPTRRAMEYSRRFGSSGMGDEDEYGVFPGVIRLANLEKVDFVRRGEIVASCDADRVIEAGFDGCEALLDRPTRLGRR